MTVLQDLRFGARLLVKKPALAAITVVTLALGIGLTTLMFSLVNVAILKGLPFEATERLVSVAQTDLSRGWENLSVRIHDFEEWREQQRAFEGLAGYSTGTFNVSGAEGAERYDGAWVTDRTFELLRVRPILGRTFHAAETLPGAEAVTIIGYRMWQDRFGGDPGVLGQTVRINGEAATIVGVMGDGFMFPMAQMMWLPERRSAAQFQREQPGAPYLTVFGRLLPGVGLDDASVQIATIGQRQAAAYPETHENLAAYVQPLAESYIPKEPRRLLMVMLGAVFGVLLIACVNVANLLLGQAALRAKEVGIRTALGAGRARIAVQFLTEPLALATVGAVLGLGIAWVGLRLFENAIAATNPPYWLDFGIDGTVLLFVVVVTLVSTLLSGVLPAIRASGSNVSEVLKDETRGASSLRGGRLTRGLVILELAVSMMLLVGAGLMIRSVTELATIDFGFDTTAVFTARFGLPEADVGYADPASRIRFFEAVEARLAEEPQIVAATLTSSLPGSWSNMNRVALEGRSYERLDDYPMTRSAVVTPGFFETFHAPILRGRGFGASDGLSSLPVTVVNRSFEDRHFPDGDALGSRIRLGGPDSEQPWVTIVGVVRDLHMGGPQNEEPEGLYLPLAQESARFLSVAARSHGPPAALTPRVRDAVAAVDSDIPIYWPRTLAEGIAQQTWFFRVFGVLFMVMGFVALFLAAIGLYGVMSFSVSRRTREMGVRMALGAGAGDVLRLVMRQGAVELATGLAIGLLLAWGLSTLLTGFLFGVSPRDPVTFAATLVVLVVTGLVAAWVPARRATRVDPLVALRYD
jgi:putative ABC transport system permease protein